MLDEPCQICGQRQAVRLLGTVAHCRPCAEAFLEPLRRKHKPIRIHRPAILGDAGPNHPPGYKWLECKTCGASWVGEPLQDCEWCAVREKLVEDEERKRLLFPPWAINGGPRYDALSDVDKRVWNQTRGQTGDADSIIVWLRQLSDAVARGDVTDDDARKAIKRIGEP